MHLRSFGTFSLLAISSAFALPTIFPQTTEIENTGPEPAVIFPVMRSRSPQDTPTMDEPDVIFPILKSREIQYPPTGDTDTIFPVLKIRDSLPNFTCEEHIAEFFTGLGFTKVDKRFFAPHRPGQAGGRCANGKGTKNCTRDKKNRESAVGVYEDLKERAYWEGETCQMLWGGKLTCWDTRDGKNI
jgi:hypothetical protein